MDNNKLFVAGLPWAYTNDMLRDLFAKFGEIVEAIIITDRETGRSKGFGFVTFANEEDAKKALEMDGTQVEERTLAVNVARPREERSNSGFGGGNRGGGNRSGGNRYRRSY